MVIVMQNQNDGLKRSFTLSAVLHVIVITALFGGLTVTAGYYAPEATEVVKATVLDEKQVAKEVQAIKRKEARRQQQIRDEKMRLAREARKLKDNVAAEKKRLAKVKADIVAQKKKQAALKKKKLADEAKKKAEAKKRLEAKKLAQEKRKTEAKKAELAKLKAEKEAKAKAKKLAAAKKKQAAQALAKANAAKLRSELEKYKALILQAISENWAVPSSASVDMTAKLMIELGGGGVVTNVQLIRSSHSAALDRSAIAAVYKASPLPVPSDKMALDQFRQFSLTVTPKDIS